MEGLHDLTFDMLAGDTDELFRRLHRDEGVGRAPALGAWVVAGHRLCSQVLTDPGFTVESAENILERTIGRMMLSTDGPDHRRQRRPYARPLLPRALNGRPGQVVAEVVAGVLDELPASGGDLVTTFSRPVARRTILTVLGLNDIDEERIETWFTAIAAAFANQAGDLDVAHAGRRAFAAFAEALGARRGRLPADSLLHQVETARVLGDAEIASNTAITIFGAVETTAALITNTLWALLSRPALVGDVRDDPDLLGRVVEETLRWQSPVQTAVRHARDGSRIGNADVPAGATVICLLGAANRDPTVFVDPDRFDPDRSELGAHLSFAKGPHLCLGAPLARLEATRAIGALLDRLPSIIPDPDGWPAPRGHEFRSCRRLVAEW